MNRFQKKLDLYKLSNYLISLKTGRKKFCSRNKHNFSHIC